ncbi:MAG: glycosyltransferase, partial [Gammaproteobacteria bacterium]|nr:glycosyltransferase [Gammaproteobacteria bacterium]
MNPSLLLLLVSVYWIVASVLFLVATGKVYFLRKEIPCRRSSVSDSAPAVSVIVPARNEENNIGACLAGLAGLEYPAAKLRIIVVDDHSTDRTAEIVNGFIARHPNIELVRGQPLPEGWTGKSHACWQGATRAQGEWLVFLDADSCVKPGLLSSSIHFAQDKGLDLLTVIPHQILKSLQERLWLPGVFLGFASFLDLGRINDPDDPYAIANGQFLLFRSEAYQDMDGHRSIRKELNDDLAFAREAKKRRLNFYCAFGEHLLETRMYRSLKEIWTGFSRNAADITQSTSISRLLANTVPTMTVAAGILVLPAMAVLSYLATPDLYSQIALGLTLPLSLILLIFFVLAVRALRIPAVYGLAVPLGLLLQGV